MNDSAVPVMFVHGLGSTYEANWVKPGWADLMVAEGRTPIGHTMAGHGAMPLLSPPEDTGTSRLHRQLSESGGLADVVGFSAGAVLSLTAAVERPELFRRLALLGAGDRPFMATLEQKRESLANANHSLLGGVRLAAERAGNDFDMVMEASYTTDPVPSFDQMAAVTCPVLIVVGEDDFIGPAERLCEALPNVRLVTLPRTDHFSTTKRLEAQDAVLSFLQG